MYRFKVFAAVFIFLFSSLFVHAQEDNLGCMSTMPTHSWENAFQDLISEFVADSNNRRSTTYTIPIVFHVIHNGESIGTYPNITLEQIKSQIAVLNQDFGGNAYNKAKYPDQAFVQWATNQDLPAANKDDKGRVKIADFNIQFCLASKDALGNTLVEPGINRINYLSEGWPDPTIFTTQMTFRTYLDKIVKPQSIWDVKKYLNVWITDKSDLLMSGGVSTVPPFSTLQGIPNTATDTTDGIWCYTKSIGSFALFPEGQYFSENIDGRTLTHEVGHYVGLRHIWGDANCGNDFCADTPPAAAQNGGNPTFPHNVGSCPSNDPDGEMFMNFMDYTMGASKYMFTTDQMIRAQTAMTFSPFRNQLGTHDLCSSPSSNEVVHFSNTPMLFPNPTSGLVTVRYFEHSIKQIHIYNHMGSYIQSYDTNVFSIEEFPSGMYFVYINTGSGSFTVKLQKL